MCRVGDRRRGERGSVGSTTCGASLLQSEVDRFFRVEEETRNMDIRRPLSTAA